MADNTELGTPPEGFEGLQLRGVFKSEPEENKEEPKVVATTEVIPPPVEYWKTVGEKVGIQFENEDQLINEIKSRRELDVKFNEVQTRLKTLDELDPMALDIDRAKKAGIGIDLYLDARNMEPEKMDSKQILWEKYLREHPDQNRTTSKVLFDDHYESNFSILEQKFDEVGQVENSKKIELAKARLDADKQSATRFLTDWKSKHITIPEARVEQGMTQEQIQSYYNQADSFVNEIEAITIKVGESDFNFGLDGFKDSLKKDLRSPIETLKRFGVDIDKGVIDPERLGELLTAYYAIQGIGKPLSEWSLEQNNLKTVKTQITQPAPVQPLTTGAANEKDNMDKLADAIEARRKQQREGVR